MTRKIWANNWPFLLLFVTLKSLFKLAFFKFVLHAHSFPTLFPFAVVYYSRV